MGLATKHFGEIQLDENKIIIFEEGIPGFENNKKYLLLSETEEAGELFCWLQSVDNGDIAFAMMDVYKVLPDYAPTIEDGDLEQIGSTSASDRVLYNIVVMPEDIKEMTVNLKAPVIINTVNKRGKQVVVLNDAYGVKHNIFEEIEKRKKSEAGE